MEVETTPSLFDAGEEHMTFSFVENGEMFVFVMDRDGLSLAVREIGKLAADPDVSLDWFSAAKRAYQIKAVQQFIEAQNG